MTKKEKVFFTVLILLLSFVPLLWFHGNQILVGYDNVFPINPYAFLSDRLFSWTSTAPFGADQSGIQGSLIIHFIDSIPMFLGLSPQLSQKIVFSFWFFLILASSYILVVRLEKERIINSPYLRYILPILYAFNFYILQGWWIAERTKFSIVVATPLILSIIIPMIKTPLSFPKILKNSILCALILTVLNGGGWIGLSLYGGLILMLVVFYIFFLINSFKNIKNIILMTIFYFFFGCFFLLLNAYTFLPFLSVTLKDYGAIVNSAGGSSGLVDWAQYLSENTSVINLLRLQGIPDWYNNLNHPFAPFYLNNILLIAASFIYAFLLIFSFLEKREENKKIVSLFILFFLISFVFTAGIHKPLGFIPEFLIRHLPGFATFRSLIFKFGYAYWLSASFLIGISLSMIIQGLISRIKHYAVIVRIGVLFIVLALILTYHFPYFSGDIFRVDKTNFSSRLTIPSYVYDFSNWWLKEGGNDRILLLPKLNQGWLFEQYKWGYLSLFPVLGNFGNKGMVENNDMLSSEEIKIVDDLYRVINEQKYNDVDNLTSILGIRYFLIRKDFSYDIPDQRTDNPNILEKKLIANNKITKVKSFGFWDVYQYKSLKPFIFAKGNAIISVGGNSFLSNTKNNQLELDTNTYFRGNELISDIFVYPNCISCEAEKQDIQVEFPKPKILIDSPLYNFSELYRKLQVPKGESSNQKISRLLGESLSMIGQLNAVLTLVKGDYYLNETSVKFEDILNEINKEYKNVMTSTPNPYSISIIIQQYLTSEAKMISEMISLTNKKNELISLERTLYVLNLIIDRYKNIYNNSDINAKKSYKFDLLSSGDYSLILDKNSIGKLLNSEYGKVNISIDDESSISARDSGEYLNFGKAYLKKGQHKLFVILSPQQNLLSDTIFQRLAGSNCYSSFIRDFSSEKIYDLRFTSRNNFDPDFFYFIDDGASFYPYLVYYFPIAGNQTKQNRIIVSVSKLPLNQASTILRVSFCAPSLTESLYKENIKDFSLVELSNPKVILEKSERRLLDNLSEISFKRINQTHYKISVKNAEKPYYLVFAERFSPNWHLTTGIHSLGNSYNNVWLIGKLGSYDLDLTYEPQKYFFYGIAVSLFSLIISLLIFIKMIKK